LLAVPFSAQEKRMPQTAGVDNSKMGPYRALAQLAYAASQKGDNAGAATLAKILERTWDKAEDYGGDMALSKKNHALFEEIDKAMDQFISLLFDYPTAAPDAAKLKSAYAQYLEKLRLGD
jgi:SAM-dependent MidA family methyltransferase